MKFVVAKAKFYVTFTTQSHRPQNTKEGRPRDAIVDEGAEISLIRSTTEPTTSYRMFRVRTGAARLSARCATRRVPNAVRHPTSSTKTSTSRTTTRKSSGERTLRSIHSRAVLQRGGILQTARIMLDVQARLGAESSLIEGEGDDDGT